MDHAADILGTVVGGRYTLLERIGGGGMANVFRARDERLQQEVALKLLRPAIESGELRARMLQEARAAAALDHPHMLRVSDVGEDLGTAYIAMELLRGGTLTRHLRAHGGRLPWRQALALLVPALDAVHHAHLRGFVHRDIKPGNLWVAERDGRPWIVVLDFGIARVDPARRGAESPPPTECGRVLGTPRYMSPEQAAGLVVDARSDVYSMAITLVHVLTGGTPEAALSSRDACVQALRAPELDLPPSLVDAIARALARRPEERLPSMRAFAALLEAARESRARPRRTSLVLSGVLAGGGLTWAGQAVTASPGAALDGCPGPSEVPACPTWERSAGAVGAGEDRGGDAPDGRGDVAAAQVSPAAAGPSVLSSTLLLADVESPPARTDLLALAGPALRRCFGEFGGADPVTFRVRLAAAPGGEVTPSVTPQGSTLARCVHDSFAALRLPGRGHRVLRRAFTLGPRGLR